MTEIPKSQWPQHRSNLLRVLISRYFMAQVFTENNSLRLSINRVELKEDGRWDQNITWEELQQVKRECGYGDRQAVEVFPADSNIINVANMRHLWVLDNPLDLEWKARK